MDPKKKFLMLHEQRVVVYNYFDTKFDEFLKNGYEKIYQTHCVAITKQFQEISASVKVLLEELQKLDPETAQIIQSIQKDEKNKLKLTIEIQMLKKEFVKNKMREEMILHERELKYDKDLQSKMLEYSALIESINDKILELSVE